MCSHITLYGDAADGALMYSEIFNRQAALGKRPFKLVDKGAQRSHGGVSGLLRSAFSETSVFSRIDPAQGSSDLDSRVKLKGQPLDMDVIDTSWMDSNVHGLRHSKSRPALGPQLRARSPKRGLTFSPLAAQTTSTSTAGSSTTSARSSPPSAVRTCAPVA